jgi:hypothetical protein
MKTSVTWVECGCERLLQLHVDAGWSPNLVWPQLWAFILDSSLEWPIRWSIAA